MNHPEIANRNGTLRYEELTRSAQEYRLAKGIIHMRQHPSPGFGR